VLPRGDRRGLRWRQGIERRSLVSTAAAEQQQQQPSLQHISGLVGVPENTCPMREEGRRRGEDKSRRRRKEELLVI
jgi:hypothetical protein